MSQPNEIEQLLQAVEATATETASSPLSSSDDGRDYLLKKIGHLKSPTKASWVESPSETLQAQYEELLKNHQEILRTRNHKIKEIQDAYLGVLEDLNECKAALLSKQDEHAAVIERLRTQAQNEKNVHEAEWSEKFKSLRAEMEQERALRAEVQASEAAVRGQVEELLTHIQQLEVVEEQARQERDLRIELQGIEKTQKTQIEEWKAQSASDAQKNTKRIEELQTLLSQARIEISALRAQLVEASEQKDSIESHANHVQEQKDQLQLALAQAQETHAASLAANRAAMDELRQEYAVQIREVQEKLTEAQALKQKDLAELTQFFLGQEKNLTESFVAVSQAHEEAQEALRRCTDERDASEELAGQLERQVAQLNGLIERTEEKIIAKQSEIDKRQHVIENLTVTQKNQAATILDLKAENERVNSLLVGVREQLVVAQQATEQERLAHQSTQQKNEGTRRALIEEKRQTLMLRQNVQGLENQIQGLQDVRALLETKLQEKSAEIAAIKDQHQSAIAAKEKTIGSLNESLKELSTQLLAEQGEHQDLQAQFEARLADLGDARTRVDEIQAETSLLRTELKQKEEQRVTLLEKQAELKELLAGQTSVEQELRNLLLGKSETEQLLTQRLNETLSQVERLKAEIALHEERQSTLKQQMMDREMNHRSVRDEIEQDRDALKGQNELLRQQLAAEQSELVVGQRELRTQKQAIENKEKQLRFFVDSLNANKTETREQLNVLFNELQLFKTMNPMADYLKVTLREIKRVELQLAKTPTISPDRARLEECLVDLVEQREFLRTNLERFQTDFEQKLKKLTTMMGGDALTLVPPPPPQVKKDLQV